MKILAFGDTHNNNTYVEKLIQKAKKHNVDFVVCNGDFADWGVNTKEILESFKKFNKKVILVPANHEDEEEVEEICKKSSYLINVNLDFFETEDVVFFGYGGGGFLRTDKYFEKEYKKLKTKFSKFKDKKLVAILHGPVYGTKLDYLDWMEDHVGSKSTLKFVKEQKPVLVISGHLHENFGQVDKVGNTLLVNPGPSGMILEI